MPKWIRWSHSGQRWLFSVNNVSKSCHDDIVHRALGRRMSQRPGTWTWARWEPVSPARQVEPMQYRPARNGEDAALYEQPF